jgi:hypothetical protein
MDIWRLMTSTMSDPDHALAHELLSEFQPLFFRPPGVPQLLIVTSPAATSNFAKA